MILPVDEKAPLPTRTTFEASVPCALPGRLGVTVAVSNAGQIEGARIAADMVLWLPALQAEVLVKPESAAMRTRLETVPLGLGGTVAPALRGHGEHRVPGGSQLALRVLSGEGRPLAPERDAGVARDGTAEIQIPVRMDARLAVRFEARSWSERRGFELGTTGIVTLDSGLSLRLEYRSASSAAAETAHGAVAWPLVAARRRLRGSERQLTGLPLGAELRVRFTDADGGTIDDVVVGRCGIA